MATEKQKCTMCGKELALINFYKSKSNLYKGNNGIMSICKNCVAGEYDNYFKATKNKETAIKLSCLKFDFPFDNGTLEGAVKQIENGVKASHLFRTYIKLINSLGSFNDIGLEFEAMDAIGVIKKQNDETTNNGSDDLDVEKIINNIKMTKEDLEVKNDVIGLIGYDIFVGYSEYDQKFLYQELLTYLDEDTLEDTFKLSQVVQLVNNNNQIRRLDLAINIMSSDIKGLLTHQGEVKSFTQMKNQIVASTDKIAKENSISVKNRGDKKAGKSTLTYLMKNLRELGFEDAEEDYYDQLKAKGMKMACDVSTKSIFEQLQLDENDYTEIIRGQREKIESLQSKLDDILEENRLLNEKIGN